MTIKFTPKLTHQSTLTLIPVKQLAGKAPEQILQAVAQDYAQHAESLQHIFQAASSEFCYQHTPHGDYLLIGLGAEAGFAQTLKVFRQLGLKQSKYLRQRLQLSFLYGNAPENLAQSIEAITNGLGQGRYGIGKYKSANEESAASYPTELLFGVDAEDTTALAKAAATSPLR